jgi:hypothetical protein
MSDAPSRSPSRRGRTLKLYLVDGTPSGVILYTGIRDPKTGGRRDED